MVSYHSSQAPHHNANHTNANHCFAMIFPDLIITAQPPRFEKPTKGSFHNPASRKNLEAFDLITTPNDLESELAVGTELLDPQDQRSQVAAISPYYLQAPKRVYQLLNHGFSSVPVLHRSGGDHNTQNQSQAVHRQMAFAPLDLFARVVAAFSCLIGCFHRLAVDDCCRRCHVSPFRFPNPVAKGVMDKYPGPILSPSPVIPIDGLPGRKITGHEPPRTARSYHVKDRIDQTATITLDRSSALVFAGLRGRNQGLDLVPFFISQISWIVSWMRLHPTHLQQGRFLYNVNVKDNFTYFQNTL